MIEHPTGWFEGMPLDEYLAIPAMSASGLESFRRSAAHYRWDRDHPKEPTPAMREGTALHLALLEPHLFTGRYVSLGQCEGAKKDGDRCTYQGSVYRDGQAFCGTHDPAKGEPMTVEVMAAEALERIEGMRRAVLEHPDARRFFVGKGRSELVGVWKDEATGALCKIRLDRDIDRAAIHADVKTCVDASRDAFRRQVGRLGYHRKAAWYRRGMKALGRPAMGSVLIAVEKQPPFGCQTFLLREDQLDALGREIDRHLCRYAECLSSDTWPAYDAGFRDFELLPWDMPEQTPLTDDDWDTEEAAA